MSKLGPYASYDKETGYHPHPLHDNINNVGSVERLNVDVKGIIHVGLWDFVEHYCYSKLVGDKVIGVEANEFVFDTMSKPVADRCGYLSFNECVYRYSKRNRSSSEKSCSLNGKPFSHMI